MTDEPINDNLMNKAVVVIGNDTAVIKSLVTQLAQKGADVALICWQMQLDSIITITESIQSTGTRFLLVEQSKTQAFSSKQLIDAIVNEFGKLDAIIDMSGQLPKHITTDTGTTDTGITRPPWLKKPSWPITKVVLDAMA